MKTFSNNNHYFFEEQIDKNRPALIAGRLIQHDSRTTFASSGNSDILDQRGKLRHHLLLPGDDIRIKSAVLIKLGFDHIVDDI